jgi:hypothetical protein
MPGGRVDDLEGWDSLASSCGRKGRRGDWDPSRGAADGGTSGGKSSSTGTGQLP